MVSISGDRARRITRRERSLATHRAFGILGPDGVLRDEAEGEFNEHGQDSWAYSQRGFDYIARDQTGYNDALHYPVFRTKDRPKFRRLIIKAAEQKRLRFGPGGAAHIRDAYVRH